MRTCLILACLVVLAAKVQAAVSIDLDLARLRAVPGADAIRARLEQALPETARARLAAIQSLTGSDPRHDLQRVLVEVPDAGAPSVRLVGLPAQRLAAALALRGETVGVCGGLTGYRLPQHPQAVFVALGERDALIGRADDLAAAPAPGALPPPAAQPIAAVIHPGAHPRLAAMGLLRELRLTADGQGHVAASATATDAAAAIELDRRFGVLRTLVAGGAQGGLPAMQRAERLLAATTVARHGAALEATIAVPDDLRQEAIDRLIGRLQARMVPRS